MIHVQVQDGLAKGINSVLDTNNKPKKKQMINFENDMKLLEKNIIDETAKLNINKNNDDNTCIGTLNVKDSRQAMSDFNQSIPYWATSMSEHVVLNAFGEENEEERDFGQEDPADGMDRENDDEEGEEEDDEEEEARHDEM